MSTSYSQKRLRFTIELLPGLDGRPQLFAGTNSSKLILTGLRARADVVSTGYIFPDASVKIWGVKEATMNQLPFFGVPNNPRAVAPAKLTIETSTSEDPNWYKLFTGQIVDAGPDYSAMPDVVLTIEARSLYLESLKQVELDKQFNGTVDIAVIAKYIADQMNVNFENNGVTGQLTDEYLPGTYTAQIRKLVQDAGVDLYIDEKDNNTLILCQPGQARHGRQVTLINAQNGLVGYPTYDGAIGPTVQILYNPQIHIGDPVQIQTGFTLAQSEVLTTTKTKTVTPNGNWRVYTINTAVSSEMPNGPWFSTLKCSRTLVGATPQ